MAKYDCSGCTALNDAVCTAIDTIGREFAGMQESERPEHVVCVIITDGMENASHEFTAKDVRDRIKCQQDVYNWDFQFLAANQDAFATGESIGLDRANCMNFFADKLGIQKMCCEMSCRIADVRSGKKRK